MSPTAARQRRAERVLALDLATRTGWALGRPGERALHGVWRLDTATGSIGAGCAALCDVLADAITVHAPGLIIYEAPLPPRAQTQAHTARFLIALTGVVELVAYRREIEVRECPVQTWKKAVVGHGFAKKDDVGAWARAQGYLPHDDNDADALALLAYAHAMQARRAAA
jgi:Holliday junction resolvasome RuvABC endonuclease subunit